MRLAGLALVSIFLLAAAAAAQEVIPLPTRPGVTETYFLASAPKNPQAIAVLEKAGSRARGKWVLKPEYAMKAH